MPPSDCDTYGHPEGYDEETDDSIAKTPRKRGFCFQSTETPSGCLPIFLGGAESDPG